MDYPPRGLDGQPPVVIYREVERKPPRRCSLCFCCPDFSPFFVCSWLGAFNRDVWAFAFLMGHFVLAARCWGRYYAAMGTGFMGAIVHGLLAVSYFQALTLRERPNALAHLVSVVAMMTRVVWWNN